MEDFGFGMFMGVMIGVVISALIFAGVIDNINRETRTEQKRFELCLKNDMQWIDGNCISNK